MRSRRQSPDPVALLAEADPAALEPRADAPPPAAVLERIVATPVQARRRRAPRLVAIATGLTVAAIVAVVAFVPAGGGVSLAERAYAATAPGDAVTYTEASSTQTENGVAVSRIHVRTWQRRDRMHDVMHIVQGGKVWDYEHDQNGEVFRTLINGKVQSIRRHDPGWRNGAGEQGFALNLQTVVEQFRARFPRLRDAGETTFNERPARAYRDGNTTYFIDRETALPLGSVFTASWYEPRRYDEKTHRVVPTGRTVETRITTTIDRYKKLPPTPENLARLDAPAIDAAQR